MLRAARGRRLSACAGGAWLMLRGTCAVHAGDTLLLFGGHTVEIDSTDKSEREIVHDDIWALNLATYQVHLALGLKSFCGLGSNSPQSLS